MQTSPRLEAFVRQLGAEGLTETEAALALIWFATHSGDGTADVTAKEVALIMMGHRMSGNINSSRLGQKLAKHPQLVRGGRAGSFRIRASDDVALSQRFAAHADLSKAPVSDLLISDSIYLGGRRHLDQVRREANGSYERAFYNAAAVMSRRLTEMLLIEALEKAGAGTRMRDASGNLLGFSDLMAIGQSGQFIKLSRTAPVALQKVKETGDGAAHHRHFLVTKRDIDALNPGFSMLVTELAALAHL